MKEGRQLIGIKTVSIRYLIAKNFTDPSSATKGNDVELILAVREGTSPRRKHIL
jgi:hypothetical protein